MTPARISAASVGVAVFELYLHSASKFGLDPNASANFSANPVNTWLKLSWKNFHFFSRSSPALTAAAYFFCLYSDSASISFDFLKVSSVLLKTSFLHIYRSLSVIWSTGL